MAIAVYFSQVRSMPLFQVLFIEHKKKQNLSTDYKKEQRQIDTKHFVTSFLIPIGISIGLAFTSMFYVFYPGQWWSHEQAFLWNFEYNLFSYYPLIVVVCSCLLLYFAYRIKPTRVENSVPVLLFISLLMPIVALIYAAVFQQYSAPWFVTFMMEHTPQNLRSLANIALNYYRLTFLACFILLSYLIYHFTVEDRKVYTFAGGKFLRGLIEEGMCILPRRVCVGDSHDISLYVKLSDDFTNRACSGQCYYESGDYIEAELQAVELKVDNEKKRMKICETSPIPITTWNCSFPTPGWHTINLVINVIKHNDNAKDIIFAQKHKVKVDRLLSASIAPVVAIITPILLSVIQYLHSLP
jgi:hypothetical protein